MATIKEDYVSFEVAKLLKEKGFDEPTIGTYYKDGTFEHLSLNRWNSKFVMALEKQMSDLRKSYVESNSPWPAGTKVVVHHRHYGGNFPTGYDEYGIIKGYEINNATDEVRPILAKIKKDGTAHPTARVYVRCNADVELCND